MKAIVIYLLTTVLCILVTADLIAADNTNFDDINAKVETTIARSNNHQLPNSIYYGSFLLQASSIIENSYYYPNSSITAEGNEKKAQLERLATEYTGNIGKNGDALRQNITSLVESIEQAKGSSYLKISEPSLLVQERSNNDVVLYFNGDFSTVTLDDTYLEVNGTKIKPAHKTDNSLSFSTSWGTLGFPINSRNFDHTTGILNLSYDGKKIQAKKAIWNDSYTIMIGLIPSGPGNLSLSNTQRSNVEEVQQRTTRNYLQHSTNGDIVEKYCVPEHSGWEIVPGSAQLIINSSNGRKDQDWFVNQSSRSGNNCFTVETLYNGLGTSGKLSFHIVYEIRRSGMAASQSERATSIDWGESIVFDIYSPDWKLKLDSFTGEHQQLSNGNINSNLLEVKVYGNTLRVTALNLKDLINPK